MSEHGVIRAVVLHSFRSEGGDKRRVKGGKEEGVGGKGRTRTSSSSQLELELLQSLHVTNSHGVPYFPVFFLVDIAKFTLNFTLFL